MFLSLPPMQMFVMGEVAVELFQESPTSFLQVEGGGCRRGVLRTNKQH